MVRSVSLGNEKKNKHLSETPLIKWNSLIPKSIIFCGQNCRWRWLFLSTLEFNNLSMVRSVSLDKEKKNKHLSETPLIKWNSLIPESIIFCGQNCRWWWLFLSTLEFNKSLSLHSHKKKRKIKFGIKIDFFTTKGTNHLLIKNDGKLKWTFQMMFKLG
jgi:hypothetical protein